jgi:hyperosmotically inducible periplasmic protein
MLFSWSNQSLDGALASYQHPWSAMMIKPSQSLTLKRFLAFAAFGASAVALVACSKTELNTAASDVKQSATTAAKSLSDTTKDLAISTQIKAELAKDPELSALAINVDTSDGRVALKGDAPNADAKARASRLATDVDGVLSVDNQLVLKSQG